MNANQPKSFERDEKFEKDYREIFDAQNLSPKNQKLEQANSQKEEFLNNNLMAALRKYKIDRQSDFEHNHRDFSQAGFQILV